MFSNGLPTAIPGPSRSLKYWQARSGKYIALGSRLMGYTTFSRFSFGRLCLCHILYSMTLFIRAVTSSKKVWMGGLTLEGTRKRDQPLGGWCHADGVLASFLLTFNAYFTLRNCICSAEKYRRTFFLPTERVGSNCPLSPCGCHSSVYHKLFCITADTIIYFIYCFTISCLYKENGYLGYFLAFTDPFNMK